jgi:hypothetical protein
LVTRVPKWGPSKAPGGGHHTLARP